MRQATPCTHSWATWRGLRRAGERELAAHVRGRGRDSRRLPGLPLGAKHAFQSIPSRRGPEGLPGRHDCEGGGQAPRGDAAESLPDTQRPRRHFSGDERAACQGDAVHVSRVLAEDAAQLRSFEGSEKQAAQNQTVSSPAAKGACLNPDLTSSPRTARTSIVPPGCKARNLPKEDFRREVEKELTGREEEPSELIYFKVYKSQIPVIEQAVETAALMLGTDKSRGYCLEMICADFLAGAHLDNGNPEILLNSISRYYKFLPGEQQQAFLENLCKKAS